MSNASRRLRVYIAGPISKGDLLHNVNQATEAFITLAKAGLAPLCPHWSVYSKPAERSYLRDVFCIATAAGNAEMSHADWLGIDLEWVRQSDAVLRLPGESSGADQEVAEAKECGIPVFQSVEELIDYAREYAKLDALRQGHIAGAADLIGQQCELAEKYLT